MKATYFSLLGCLLGAFVGISLAPSTAGDRWVYSGIAMAFLGALAGLKLYYKSSTADV